jgi:hypothetical protein
VPPPPRFALSSPVYLLNSLFIPPKTNEAFDSPNHPVCAKGQTPRHVRNIVRRMESDKPARWKELCQQVSNEQDPAKVLALSQEILRLLQKNGDRRPDRKISSAA